MCSTRRRYRCRRLIGMLHLPDFVIQDFFFGQVTIIGNILNLFIKSFTR